MPTSVPPVRPTLVLLHALGSSRREFDALADRLGGRFEMLAIDLPGFGEEPAAAGVTLDEMVGFVERRIRRARPARWILVGHSMGGKVASLVAGRTLSGAAGLFGLAGVILLAASPPAPEPMDEARRHEMLSWGVGGTLDATAARNFVDGNVGAPLDPVLDAMATADVERSSAEAWCAWLTRGSLEDRSADVGVIDLPALIVAGGADGDLGEEAQRTLNVPVYPRADVLVLEGAGHYLPTERPDEVAGAIDAFWTHSAGLGPSVSADFGVAIASNRTSARTRGILARRALADDPDYRPRAVSAEQLATLRGIASRVVPQDDAPIDLAARVDAQLHAGVGDGWRSDLLPPDRDAYRQSLDALAGFDDSTDDEQDDALKLLAAGEFPATADTPTAEAMAAWFEDAKVDLVRQWLAHPATMERIGYDGTANGGDDVRLQGWHLLAAGEREDWEPTMGVTR